jgi:hypothetical protein
MITRHVVAQKIAAWLHHDVTLTELVDWAEQALQEDDFAEEDAIKLVDVVARLGVADVRTFGLSWDDCEELLKQLGYNAHVEISAA